MSPPDDIGAYYDRKRDRADKLREAIAILRHVDGVRTIIRDLEDELERARNVGD